MRPLNMMLAGGDVGGTESGRRGIEACKEKLKEGLTSSDQRNAVFTAAAAAAPVVATPSHWRRTAIQTMRETELSFLGVAGGGGGGVGRCGDFDCCSS